MNKFGLRYISLMFLLLLLSACLSPKTPQDVAQVFWESVVKNDAKDVVEYSTLVDVKQFDRFSKDWAGFQVSWGRVVIDGDQASIESRFSKAGGSEADNREFTTYLVRRNGEWIVDYVRTSEEVRGGVILDLLGALSDVGKELSAQLESAAKEFSNEMERMGKEFEEHSESLDQQASKSVEKFAEELQRSIIELEKSIERALQEQENNLSERDRRVLNQVVIDLSKNREILLQPNLKSIAESSKNIAKARKQLDSIDRQVAEKYQRQWQAWGEKVESDTKHLLNQISSAGAEEL